MWRTFTRVGVLLRHPTLLSIGGRCQPNLPSQFSSRCLTNLSTRFNISQSSISSRTCRNADGTVRAPQIRWTAIRRNTTGPEQASRPNSKKPKGSRESARSERSKSMVLYLMSMGLSMFALTFASAPLYSVFCRVTGLGGASRLAKLNESAQREAEEKMKQMRPLRNRQIRVRFEADVDKTAYWEFAPVVREVRVYPGEPTLAFFTATNPTDADAIGIATYTILPYEAAQHFIKVQCFCFDEQRIGARETVQLPVLFYIDTAYDNDPRLEYVEDIVLSYTFHESKDAEELLAAGVDLRQPQIPANMVTSHTASVTPADDSAPPPEATRVAQ